MGTVTQYEWAAIGDLHWRLTAPRGRKDDFHGAMVRKMHWVLKQMKERGCAKLIIPGDVFHEPTPRVDVVNDLVQTVRQGWEYEDPNPPQPLRIYFVAGNHDLPGHHMNNLAQSGIYLLSSMSEWVYSEGESDAILGMGYRKDFFDHMPVKFSPSIFVGHVFVYNDKPPFDVDERGNLAKLAETIYGQNKVFIFGDHHKGCGYFEDTSGCIFVNLGSFMRMTTAQRGHEPNVLFFSNNGKGKPDFSIEPIPVEEDVWDEESIQQRKEADARKEDVEKLLGSFRDMKEASISFEGCLHKVLSKVVEDTRMALLKKLEEISNGKFHANS